MDYIKPEQRSFSTKLEENQRRCINLFNMWESEKVDMFYAMALKRQILEEFLILKKEAKKLEKKATINKSKKPQR